MTPPEISLSLDELLGRVADFTDDCILITEAEPFDLPGPRILYVNPAFTRMTGYTLEDVIGHTPRVLQGPGTDQVSCAKIRAALVAWKPIRIELLNYRKDGSEFWVELNITPVADHTGWFRYWVSVQREISERHLHDAQQRLNELILNNVSEGIVVADAQQPGAPIEFINAGFTAMTGYSLADILGRSFEFLQGNGTDPDAHAKLAQGIDAAEPVTVELLNYRKDGTPFWNLMTITPLRDAKGKVIKFVGVQRDVTATKQQQVEQVASQRLRAVGEMTGGIAHDFNNLLTAISGASELLLQHSQSNPDQTALAQTIHSAANRGTSQVRRLMAFSRTPLLARGSVDLGDLLAKLQALLIRSLHDDIELVLDLSDDARWVDAEAVQLESALLNLVLNAQDAMPRGGRIEIRASAVAEAGRPMVCLLVRDNGAGIDEATQAQIFEPFFTTKPVGRGSGLGLAMVRAFVSQLNGRIEVQSQVGQGTTFVLTLPAAHAPQADDAPPASTQPMASSACRVLLVEDDDVVRITANAMLRSLGHQVTEAANADEALELLSGDLAIDLLLTDILMPGHLSGRDLADQVHQSRPTLPIVLSSGWADSELPTNAGATDQHHFLLKPYTLAELQQAIALASGRPIA